MRSPAGIAHTKKAKYWLKASATTNVKICENDQGYDYNATERKTKKV